MVDTNNIETTKDTRILGFFCFVGLLRLGWMGTIGSEAATKPKANICPICPFVRPPASLAKTPRSPRE